VSARHVVEKTYNLQARVECLHLKTKEPETVLLDIPHGKWTFHKNNGDKDTNPVDVAAIKISGVNKIVRGFSYNTDPNVKIDNQLAMKDPEPPKPILVFGFPADIGFGLLEQRPMGRLGIISMKTGKEFLRVNGKYAESRCSLIDARIFPGNSGGPVINQLSAIETKPKLLGLVIVVNPTLDFAIIEPISRIRETILEAQKNGKFGNWRDIPKN